MRLLLFILLLAGVTGLAPLTAAQKAQPHEKYNKNKEMPRPAEVPEVWKMQAEEVVEHETQPWISGAYMWRGRADRDYLAFHQWEMRVSTKAAQKDLKIRITPLGSDFQPLRGENGHWVTLGTLGAGKSVDISYKRNTSHPALYRVELEWAGGEQSFLADTPAAVPQIERPAGGGPRLIAMEPDHGYDAKRKMAMVEFYLRNIGDKEATGVEHRIVFLDGKGKQVFGLFDNLGCLRFRVFQLLSGFFLSKL